MTGGPTDDELLFLLTQISHALEAEVAITTRINESKIDRSASTLTVYLDFIGPLQGMLGSRDIKIDFTLNEELVFPLSRRDIIARFSDCEPLSRQLNVYSLEEILTEKLCALIGRTEPRDLYDAHFLLGLGGLDYQSIPQAFKTKASRKGVDPGRLYGVLQEREATISRLWDNRLALQVDSLPPVERVLRETRQTLRKFRLV